MKGRRGFSLIEAAVIVLMIAVAVPTSVRMLGRSSDERTDRVMMALATTYAGAVLEQVLSDVSAGGLDVLVDADGYLDSPGVGLWARLAWVSEPYEARGLDAEVEISGLVDRFGEVSADAEENLFRVVTARVSFGLSSGEVLSMPVSMMVTEAMP